MEITIEKTVKETINVEFPLYRIKIGGVGREIVKIKSPESLTIINTWQDGSFHVGTYTTKDTIHKWIVDGTPVTHEEWQNEMARLQSLATLFFSENLIPSREQVDSL